MTSPLPNSGTHSGITGGCTDPAPATTTRPPRKTTAAACSLDNVTPTLAPSPAGSEFSILSDLPDGTQLEWNIDELLIEGTDIQAAISALRDPHLGIRAPRDMDINSMATTTSSSKRQSTREATSPLICRPTSPRAMATPNSCSSRKNQTRSSEQALAVVPLPTSQTQTSMAFCFSSEARRKLERHRHSPFQTTSPPTGTPSLMRPVRVPWRFISIPN